MPVPTFGIVVALPEELVAMRALLDDPGSAHVADDPAEYVVGITPSAIAGDPHGVVLTVMARPGTDLAASACTNLLRSFRSVNCVIMAGIAAGVPNVAEPDKHVRLGDVVVATWGVVDYDHVDETVDGPRLRPGIPGPSPLLSAAANRLRVKEQGGLHPWREWLDCRRDPALARYARPPEATDLLYSADHPDQVVAHPPASTTGHEAGSKVHYGLIGSADRSLRNARVRDSLASAHNLRAIEMEGKGIANGSFLNGLEWFMVRGISDYGDQRTGQTWRAYAALVAAAYTRALLAECPPVEPRGGHPRGSPAGRSGEAGHRQHPGAGSGRVSTVHIEGGSHRFGTIIAGDNYGGDYIE